MSDIELNPTGEMLLDCMDKLERIQAKHAGLVEAVIADFKQINHLTIPQTKPMAERLNDIGKIASSAIKALPSLAAAKEEA